MRGRLLWSLVLAALTFAAESMAGDAGRDVVHLVGGGFYRGTILVLERGKRVVIQLADGKTETVTWDKVEKVTLSSGQTMEGGDATRPAKPDPGKQVKASEGEAKPAVERAPARAPGRDEIPEHVRAAEMPGYEPAFNVLDPTAPREVKVVLQAEPGVRLMRDREGATEAVCAAPCGQRYAVAEEDRMYLAGDGMPSSAAIDLYGSSGEVKAVVDSGNTLFFAGGIALSAAGFATAIVCTTYTVVERDGLSYWPPEPEPFGTAIGAGIGLVVGVAGTVGAVLMNTRVTLVDTEQVSVTPGGVRWRF